MKKVEIPNQDTEPKEEGQCLLGATQNLQGRALYLRNFANDEGVVVGKTGEEVETMCPRMLERMWHMKIKATCVLKSKVFVTSYS